MALPAIRTARASGRRRAPPQAGQETCSRLAWRDDALRRHANGRPLSGGCPLQVVQPSSWLGSMDAERSVRCVPTRKRGNEVRNNAQPFALGTGAVGAVEAECPRLDLFKADLAIRAGVERAEQFVLPRADCPDFWSAKMGLSPFRRGRFAAFFITDDDRPAAAPGWTDSASRGCMPSRTTRRSTTASIVWTFCAQARAAR